jgi:nucleoside-diphosphate-sugar epimerase
MNRERFLVTGAQGCLGAWVVRNLLESGYHVTAYDLDPRPTRISLLLTAEDMALVDFVEGDINDTALLDELMDRRSITHVIHLAALMTPDCAADPVRGAKVNVLGTLSVFEAVKGHRDRVQGIVYASSAAVLGPDEEYEASPVPDPARPLPGTLYGVFKTANEHCARVYWEDERIRSVGLRPGIIYGPGRDRGLSAGPTLAVEAALLDREYEIAFGGTANMQFVDDVAKAFVACAFKLPTGAPALNMNGELLDVGKMIEVLEELVPSAKGKITYRRDQSIRMASIVSDAGLQGLIGTYKPTPFRAGIGQTIGFYRGIHGIT